LINGTSLVLNLCFIGELYGGLVAHAQNH